MMIFVLNDLPFARANKTILIKFGCTGLSNSAKYTYISVYTCMSVCRVHRKSEKIVYYYACQI